jgi:hypothetical protein
MDLEVRNLEVVSPLHLHLMEDEPAHHERQQTEVALRASEQRLQVVTYPATTPK